MVEGTTEGRKEDEPRYAFITFGGLFHTRWEIRRLRDHKVALTGRKWGRNSGQRAWSQMQRVAEKYGYAEALS